MYKTKEIRLEELDKIQVKNQIKIKQITGTELKPKEAWEIIKKESQDFSKKSAKAQEADALLAELMQVNGLVVSKSKNDDQERIRVRERERARAIEIIKLKLQIAA